MLHLHFSNRFESLRQTLLEQLALESPDPFTAQQVIVPSTAVMRHLEWALTEDRGICANVTFSYLAQWIWRQIGKIIAVQTESPFAPEVLTWRVYQILSDADFLAAHDRLHNYLRENDPVRQHDLASRIARLFEQYVTYRPLWLETWSQGRWIRPTSPHGTAIDEIGPPRAIPDGPWQHEAWQSALWRRIASETGTTQEHPGQSFFRALQSLGSGHPESSALPSHAHVFCLPSVAPLYLSLLRGLSSRMELNVYVLNPCQEYWYEIVDRKRLSALISTGQSSHHETGNRLLAAWGKQTQAHIDLLLSDDNGPEELHTQFLEAPGHTMLGQLQNSILHLVELESTGPAEQTSPVSLSISSQSAPVSSSERVAVCSDESLQVHICHSLQRELEVLQAQLLALFDQPQPPAPDEILVVTPNLVRAAPLIDAVFGAVASERRLPYLITGLPQRRVNPIARVLDQLLALALGRHPASEVFELLTQPAVMRRFELDTEQAERLGEWLEIAGIRWALDGSERLAHGLPADERHTFSDGLQRLFLAYAMGEGIGDRVDPSECLGPDDGSGDGLEDGVSGLIGERVGAGNPTGTAAPALGILWRFIQELDRLRRDWQIPKTPEQWHGALHQALECFAAAELPWVEDFSAVRRAINDLHDHMIRGGLRVSLPLAVIREALGEQLDQGAQGGAPSGRITFAAISSLRALPYRFIFAFGLNDGEFPTASSSLEFDLIAAQPRRGDRQRRLDERNQFLDLVISARDRLVLSYTGRNVRDNSRIPPSVLIADLVDQIERNWPGAAARITHEHRLQAFSPIGQRLGLHSDISVPTRTPALSGNPLGSEPAQTGEVMFADDATEPGDAEDSDSPLKGLPFFTEELPAPDAHFRQVSLQKLLEFFKNPARFLLRHRLGIRLTEDEPELRDEEPFTIDPLMRRMLEDRLLPHALEGLDVAGLARLARAGPELPSGSLGHLQAQQEAEQLRRFAIQIRRELRQAHQAPLTHDLLFNLDGDSWVLHGTIQDLRSQGLVRWNFGPARAETYLTGWITHLFLCTCDVDPAMQETRWYSRDGSYRLRRVTDARTELEKLLALYQKGLAKPLQFFPRSAWKLINTGKPADALNVWQGNRDRSFGENSDPAYQLALRGLQNPLGKVFTELAQTIYQPMLSHLDDDRVGSLLERAFLAQRPAPP